MELRITINEQVVSKILDAVVKAMAQPTHDGQSAQVEALQKQVASLQAELARMKAPQPKPVAQPTASQPKPMATQPIALQSMPKLMPTEQVQKTAPIEKPQAKSAEPAKPVQSAQPVKQNGSYATQLATHQANQPDAEKAEKWVRENLLEWLDQPCPFAKAQGRSWKQLCQNEGEKIVIKGKLMPPRAYLHVLENWDECQAWAKLKAKVALEYGKNGN